MAHVIAVTSPKIDVGKTARKQTPGTMLARAKAKQLPGAHALSSPGGQDANDLLQAGLLGGFLSAARQRACQTPEERQRLLWALLDAASAWAGVDSGTAQIMRRLAADLGKEINIEELRPNRWVT